MSTWLSSANAEYDLPENVPLIDAPARLSCFFQWKLRRDWHAQLRLLNCPVEPFKFTNASDRVIRDNLYALPLFRGWLNAVRASRPPCRSTSRQFWIDSPLPDSART
jgi:hypothetical protein